MQKLKPWPNLLNLNGMEWAPHHHWIILVFRKGGVCFMKLLGNENFAILYHDGNYKSIQMPWSLPAETPHKQADINPDNELLHLSRIPASIKRWVADAQWRIQPITSASSSPLWPVWLVVGWNSRQPGLLGFPLPASGPSCTNWLRTRAE